VSLPVQAPPVLRPDLVQPHRTVDATRGTAAQLISVRMDLMLGANYNDPAPMEFASCVRMKVSSAAR
jgi:cyanobactin biosynthesis protein (PatB/AcyB/McaB family)